MPTPESAAAFEKLSEARTRLNEITRELNEAHAKMLENCNGRARHIQLQKDWAEAFDKFQTATEELAGVLRTIKSQIESE